MGGLLAGSRTRLLVVPGTWAGRAGVLLAGQGLCHTHLGLSGWRVGWAGPEASRRHVRHASRRAEGLGLRLVSRRGWACWMIWARREEEVKAWLAWLSCRRNVRRAWWLA